MTSSVFQVRGIKSTTRTHAAAYMAVVDPVALSPRLDGQECTFVIEVQCRDVSSLVTDSL